MGRWAALLILGLSLAPLLRADGDSGTLLATPQRYKDGQLIPNATSATIRLGSESDPLVGKRDGWAALGGDFCYARATGVGLRGDGKSVLYRPFDPPETISYVSVVCGVESKSALGKPLALALSLGTREVKTQEFTIENPGETRTVTFAFTPTEAPDIRLTNESDTVFEVQRVSWFADAPPITVEVDITPAPAGGTIRCSVASCTGGSGTYTRVRWTFNGNTSSAVDHIQSMATFTAPDREGTYPLTLEIADDQGNSRTFSYSVIVGADATVAYPIVSNVTRTGFTLSWDRPASGFSPEAFAVRVFRSDLLNVTLTPEWSPAGDGWNSPEFSLDDALDGLDAQNVAVTVPKDWQGDLKYYVGNGSWTPLLRVDDTFLSFALSPGQPFRFRVEKAKPPASLELNAGLSHTYEEEKIPLEGQKLTRTFTDLPAGKTVKVSITAHGRKDDGTLTYYNSPELSVPLLPIPVPSAIFDSSGRIRFKWDSLALDPGENPTISLRLFAETPAETALPPGLYLTRVLLTQNKAAKAIALTNTSASPIPLDGKTYTLTYGENDWDFYVKDANNKNVHTLVVPAHGDLVIVANQYRPADLREGVAFATANAIRYLKDAGPVTLLRNGTPINKLTPVMDAVVRLPADSLTGATSTPAAQADPKIDALYDPWPQATSVTAPFYQGTYTPANRYLETKTLLTKRPEGATRVWAELRTTLNGSDSDPQILELWATPTTPSGTPRPGFRLRLR